MSSKIDDIMSRKKLFFAYAYINIAIITLSIQVKRFLTNYNAIGSNDSLCNKIIWFISALKTFESNLFEHFKKTKKTFISYPHFTLNFQFYDLTLRL